MHASMEKGHRQHHQVKLPSMISSAGGAGNCQQQRQHCSDDWVPLDFPRDITIDVNGVRFTLHKFPLITRSARIRKLVAEHPSAEISRIDLHNLPGGSATFELAAKFCYGVKFEISTANVAQLCCVSDYLEMTEEHSYENLASNSEAYLDNVVCKNFGMCVEVLRQCENLLPLADELKIVGRCIDAIASMACAEQMASSFSRLEYSSSGRLQMAKQTKSSGDWWTEDLSVLRIDLYQRVLDAMKCRGVRPESLAASLMNYSERLFKMKPILNSSNHYGVGKVSTQIVGEEKAVIETIVSLLPTEKLVPLSFLFGLLRSAVILDGNTTCRLNLERRIGSQLDMATLDDLLIPSAQHAGDTLFDVDTIHRILVIFSQLDDSEDEGLNYDSDTPQPPSQTAIVKVSKLADSYLAEIAPDANLKLAKFIAIADTLPSYARTTDDGLYRATDVYLKAHQGLSELERKRLCKLIDFRKLSEEASAHAAQNERLPVQATVQVLYIEQLRLRNVLCCPCTDEHQKASFQSRRMSHGMLSADRSPDNYASLRRENRELKLELARMRMRLSNLEKGHASMKKDIEKSGSRKLMDSVSKKIIKLNFFSHSPFRTLNSSSSKAPKEM